MLHMPAAPPADYCRPAIKDYGSLAAMTADLDLHFVGSVAQLVSFAAASVPLGGGGGDAFVPSDVPSDGGTPPGSGGGVLGDLETADLETAGGGDEGATAGDGAAGGGSGGGVGGAGSGGAGSGGSGELPFTGYAVMTFAALGAAFTTAGLAVRDRLQRRR